MWAVDAAEVERLGLDHGLALRVATEHRPSTLGAPGVTWQTVILDHGGGYYSVYTRLQSLSVVEGQAVGKGQMIGRVGGEADAPHIELQIYEPGSGGPRAVDPVRWLRDRS